MENKYISLSEEFFEDLLIDASEEKQLVLWESIEAYQKNVITFDMGKEMVVLDAARKADFIAVDQNHKMILDENENFCIDNEKVENFIDHLCDSYNTYGKEREFLTHDGSSKLIQKGTYGTEIDRQIEIEFLLNALNENRTEIHIPTYLKTGYTRGIDDIGDTYIEIDMGNQLMFLYVDGDCVVETEIVTGNERRKMLTPEGIYYVYNKQRNRILRGQDYASPVKYWVPIVGNIGIHDASWRKEFGGEIYKTSGSHGCINTPTEKMSEIYELIEIGTPVIAYY